MKKVCLTVFRVKIDDASAVESEKQPRFREAKGEGRGRSERSIFAVGFENIREVKKCGEEKNRRGKKKEKQFFFVRRNKKY